MAKLFLDNDTITISEKLTVYGSSGSNDKLIINDGALGSTVNANVETLQFSGKFTDYTFAIVGNQLQIGYQGSLLATVGIQDDSNGTQLTFSDVTTAVNITGMNQATIGKVALTTTLSNYTNNQLNGQPAVVNRVEQEVNNTTQTATIATLNTAIAGQLASSSDVDYYKYTVGSSGSLTINFDAPTNDSYSSYFKISVFNASGTLLVSQKTGKDFSFNASALTAGDYYVAVSIDEYYHDSGQYSLTTSHTAGNANSYENESNNTLSTANTASLNTAVSGQLASSSDVDYYKYTVGSSGSLTINFDAPTNSSASYFKISVFNASGTLLVSQKTGKDFSFNASALTAGDYYVAVSIDEYYHDSGQYSLTTSHTAGNANSYENESNNSLANANIASLNAAISGQLASSSDVDYYKYTVGSSGSLTINFDAPTNSSASYFKISVFNASGTLLVSQKTGKDFSFNASALTAGDYYVAVSIDEYYHDSGQYSLTTSHTAGNANSYENESNNSLANANIASLNAAISGQLASSSDVDYYKYTVGSSGSLTINFDAPTNSSASYFKISVFNASGTLLVSQKTGKDFSFNASALTAGDYYVAVSIDEYYHDSGQYSLTTSHTAGNANSYENESNNTLSTANTASLNTAVSGQLASSSDVDYYKYTVGSSGSLTINFDAPTNSSASYFKISVFNASGTLLVSQKTGKDFSFNASALTAGDYYVAVSIDEYYHDSGQYSLTTSHTAGNANSYENESNNSLANANIASLNAAISGQLASSSDVDYYKYTVGSSGSLTINFDAPTNSSASYFKISVFNASGTLLVSQKTGKDFSFNASALTAGDYYVAVSIDDYYHNSGQYSLTTSHTASIQTPPSTNNTPKADFTFNGSFGIYDAQVKASLIEGVNDIFKFINANATINFEINSVTLSTNTLASAGSSLYQAKDPNNLDVEMISIVQNKLMTGYDLNGSGYDAVININTNYLSDADFTDDGITSYNKFDFTKVITHEVFHTIGFNGLYGTTGQSIYESHFDTFIAQSGSNFYFTGDNAESLNGGYSVLLTDSNAGSGSAYYHVTNQADLMSMSSERGTSPMISALDLAMLKDIGIPLIGIELQSYTPTV